MKKVILFIATSEDGYIARRDGSIDWLTSWSFSEGEDGGFQSFYARISTILIARKTFEHVLQLTEGPYPHQDRETYLITSNENYPTIPEIHGEKLSVWSKDIVGHVRRLKEEDGNDIWLCGGSTIINILMHAKLIDEWNITVLPVRLGDGIPLWDETSRQLFNNLVCKHERHFDGCTQKIYEKGIGS